MGNSFRDMSAVEIRRAIRTGHYSRHTAGLAKGKMQANLVVLPEAHALDFMRYCQRNPQPCPVIGVTDTGDSLFRTLGADIDVCTDLPSYNVYREGKLSEQHGSIRDLWRDDLVAFALGCSFTFEHALKRAGIALWHVDHDRTVPMYRTRMPTVAAGPFSGPMVVSMRPLPDDRIAEAIKISAAYPLAHGAPVHVGAPHEIGIEQIDKPDWGDKAAIGTGETPVFWACGVTPQVAIAKAALPFCITHTPGHMLITDIPEDAQNPIIAAADLNIQAA